MKSCKVLSVLVAVTMVSTAWAGGKGPILLKTPKTFPLVISQPGSYQLTGNITVPTATAAIRIDASDVALDLNGFTVQCTNGTATTGIDTSSATQRNITIRNGSVVGFSGNGVNLMGGNHQIVDLKVGSNGNSGIYVSGAALVARCIVTDNTQSGISVGKASLVKESLCCSNSINGISVGQSSTVLQNTCNSNGSKGIYAEQGSSIMQNTCSENGSTGINTGGRCLVQQNSCFFNQIGIEDSAAGSQIKNNVCTINTSFGIAVVSDCEISHNSCNRLNGTGIFCGGSNNSVVENSCLQNTVGINLGNGGSNYCAQNKLSANGSAITNSAGDTLGAGDLANVSF